ncbi:hypothetical protein M976_02171 [Buttiauxella ferragutiae ATCC 51602]|uniref:Uncharacterized protein n=1 Tax=Buttiauxella ferragutiae ATCC 51602 TaxID=1354252 RepID=A0ABX2W966_9ENTR|nr:hypothetical protein M976_02171 [Buttiauxella ferragutiae ATCC 51602]
MQQTDIAETRQRTNITTANQDIFKQNEYAMIEAIINGIIPNRP